MAGLAKRAREAGAHRVLIDESGAFLSPPVRRRLAPRGKAPIIKVPGRKRQKVSLIAALTLAPRQNRIGLYFRCFPDRHVTQVEAAQFMRDVLKHLRGQVHVIWDRGDTHKGDAIRGLHRDYPRLTSHWLPSYAPELNPVEFVWNHAKYGPRGPTTCPATWRSCTAGWSGSSRRRDGMPTGNGPSSLKRNCPSGAGR